MDVLTYTETGNTTMVQSLASSVVERKPRDETNRFAEWHFLKIVAIVDWFNKRYNFGATHMGQELYSPGTILVSMKKNETERAQAVASQAKEEIEREKRALKASSRINATREMERLKRELQSARKDNIQLVTLMEKQQKNAQVSSDMDYLIKYSHAQVEHNEFAHGPAFHDEFSSGQRDHGDFAHGQANHGEFAHEQAVHDDFSH